MNPWDADLVIVEGQSIDYEGDRWLYAGETKEIGLISSEAPGGADQWAKFFQAAPKMVRALLLNGTRNYRWSRGGGWHTYDCWKSRHALNTACSEACKATRAALKAAGVPIP